MERRWKLVTGGAALAGLTAGGVAGAVQSDLDLNDRPAPIKVASTTAADSLASPGAPVDAVVEQVVIDASPESVDSPNESASESIESPFDSPDDEGIDPSPESVDSPDMSVEESVESVDTVDTVDSVDLSADDSPDSEVAPASAPDTQTDPASSDADSPDVDSPDDAG